MKKRIIAFLLSVSGILFLKLLWIKIFGSKKLRILCYHRVLDINPEEFEFDNNVVDASVLNFEKQMRFVSSHFNVITFRELSEYRKNGKLPRNPIIITFDDGYRDNFTNAFPILRKYNLSATIFLTTSYLESRKIFWWDALAYYVKNTARKELHFELTGCEYRYDLSTRKLKLLAVGELNKIINCAIRNNKNTSVEEIIKQLMLLLDVHIDPAAAGNYTLSWDDVRDMSRGGIEFGSHSGNHNILPLVCEEGLRAEIADSKRRIEKELSREVSVFSYPMGLYNAECLKILNEEGIEFGCIYNPPGVNSEEYLKDNPMTLRRINVDGNHDMKMFRSYLCFPEFMGSYIKRAGKNNGFKERRVYESK